MIKNSYLQENSTHNVVKKSNIIKFGYRLVVTTTLATTIQSCGSGVGYKSNPEEFDKMQQRIREEHQLEIVRKRELAAERYRIHTDNQVREEINQKMQEVQDRTLAQLYGSSSSKH